MIIIIIILGGDNDGDENDNNCAVDDDDINDNGDNMAISDLGTCCQNAPEEPTTVLITTL